MTFSTLSHQHHCRHEEASDSFHRPRRRPRNGLRGLHLGPGVRVVRFGKSFRQPPGEAVQGLVVSSTFYWNYGLARPPFFCHLKNSILNIRFCDLLAVWPVKSLQMSIEVAQKWFTRKMKLYKNCLKCGRFGQNNCCHMLWKVAQIAIYCPTLSHCHLVSCSA